ncbi:MAG: DEAD/DEAH box helicase family protein [Proteobacteria bacterium]|nr:DEAD/DEAH box helicase family protein [Pseudomonadota bacterium]
MEIKFNPDLDYQQDAIQAITRIFEGQEVRQTNFSVPTTSPQMQMFDSGLGVGNKLERLDDELLENVRDIQLNSGLKQVKQLGSKDFTIEMETGTGKTYVYLRTIFELNKKYGFTKFIIVVPSLAIKEGVYKSLQITDQHFKGLYDNVQYDYFVYDSQKLGEVRNFATNDCIQIMVINIDAFRKSFDDPSKETQVNIIHRPNDRMSGSKPIEFIQATNPIVIIDEPQSVDSTPKSKEAIKSLNPLCTLRYSATHKEKYNLMYKLDSIDAYEQKLVKQIEVASIQVKDGHNKPYIKLLKVDNRKSPIQAHIEFDKTQAGKTKRVKKWVRCGDDLHELSNGRSVYEGYIINEIFCEPGSEFIDFTSKEEFVRLGEAIGGVNDEDFKRLQIRKTIEEHLKKELVMTPKGIKVLSLFFIDKVANYRAYDEDGNPGKGKYALIFEEEYQKLVKSPKYNTLFDKVEGATPAEEVHDGYFAKDKKKDAKGEGRFKESQGGGTAVADGSAYKLIMQDKEKLLSFDSELKFIFSHSALREGWDSPNVFQICTLNETGSVMKKRQEIGRGLRIAVNQEGERVYGFDVNTLTVMANESYEDFVSQLQKEIEEDEGIRFGVVDDHLFANIPVEGEDNKKTVLGTEGSEEIWQHLLDKKYIDKNGKVQNSLLQDLKEDQVSLPPEMAEHAGMILARLKKVTSGLNIKDASKKEIVTLNKGVYLGEEFKELWDRVKYKTTFRVQFDVGELVTRCAEHIRENLVVGKTKFIYEKDKVKVLKGGLKGDEKETSQHVYDIQDFKLPDILSFLQNETNLTRKTLAEILVKCDKLQSFKNNPQKFIDEVGITIKNQMRHAIVDGIKYQKIGASHFYAQELFENEELTGYLHKNMLEAKKSVFNYVVYDSDIEAGFAKSFEASEDVKVYAKLPGWFKIDTPLGGYNPDWAVLINCDGAERLYFVVESKGSTMFDMLRPAEQAKIKCGTKHFAALGTDVEFTVADSFETLMDKI